MYSKFDVYPNLSCIFQFICAENVVVFCIFQFTLLKMLLFFAFFSSFVPKMFFFLNISVYFAENVVIFCIFQLICSENVVVFCIFQFICAENVVEVLKADGRFSTLVTALEKASLVEALAAGNPPASKASREVENLTERKNPPTPIYGVKEFVCLSVCCQI